MTRGFLPDRVRFQLEERLEAVELFEQSLARQGKVSDRTRLPHHRVKFVLKLLGGAVIAINVAILAMLGNFIVFNMLIHASF